MSEDLQSEYFNPTDSIWPNGIKPVEGKDTIDFYPLGKNKMTIDSNFPWPEGDALIGSYVYDKDGKLVAFCDTKSLEVIDNNTKIKINYNVFQPDFDFIIEDTLTITDLEGVEEPEGVNWNPRYGDTAAILHEKLQKKIKDSNYDFDGKVFYDKIDNILVIKISEADLSEYINDKKTTGDTNSFGDTLTESELEKLSATQREDYDKERERIKTTGDDLIKWLEDILPVAYEYGLTYVVRHYTAEDYIQVPYIEAEDRGPWIQLDYRPTEKSGYEIKGQNNENSDKNLMCSREDSNTILGEEVAVSNKIIYKTDTTLTEDLVLPYGGTLAKGTKLMSDISDNDGNEYLAGTTLTKTITVPQNITLSANTVLAKDSAIYDNTILPKGTKLAEDITDVDGVEYSAKSTLEKDITIAYGTILGANTILPICPYYQPGGTIWRQYGVMPAWNNYGHYSGYNSKEQHDNAPELVAWVKRFDLCYKKVRTLDIQISNLNFMGCKNAISYIAKNDPNNLLYSINGLFGGSDFHMAWNMNEDDKPIYSEGPLKFPTGEGTLKKYAPPLILNSIKKEGKYDIENARRFRLFYNWGDTYKNWSLTTEDSKGQGNNVLSAGKIYHVKISELDDNTGKHKLVRHYIPIKDRNGNYCLVDELSGRVFRNQNPKYSFTCRDDNSTMNAAITVGLDNKVYVKKTNYGYKHLNYVPDGYDISIDEYAAKYGYKELVFKPKPEEGEWMSTCNETETQFIQEWIEC